METGSDSSYVRLEYSKEGTDEIITENDRTTEPEGPVIQSLLRCSIRERCPLDYYGTWVNVAST